MTRTPPSARARKRRISRPVVAGLIVATAAITAALTYQVPNSSSSPEAASSATAPPSSAAPSSPAASPSATPSRPADPPPGGDKRADHNGALGESGGALPEGVTVFDDGYPGVAKLDPDLLQALREAATDAADDGVKFYVNSGWRSPERQNQLLREAVSKYGSEEEAARWVATADTSPHVSGDAIDLGKTNATAWLSQYGARYGLCQIYRNEPWHYELRTSAAGQGCPRMYADPTQDPRMQQ